MLKVEGRGKRQEGRGLPPDLINHSNVVCKASWPFGFWKRGMRMGLGGLKMEEGKKGSLGLERLFTQCVELRALAENGSGLPRSL